MLQNLPDMTAKEIYFAMIDFIVPRPIAWVISSNADRGFNIAPFSYFNGVSSDPPLLSISVGKKRDGSKKDTWVNIEEDRPFVIQIPEVADLNDVNKSAECLEYGKSEFKALATSIKEVDGWPVPVTQNATKAMLCKKYRIIEIGPKPQALILAEIISFWSKDNCATNPLARLGGDDYASVQRI